MEEVAVDNAEAVDRLLVKRLERSHEAHRQLVVDAARKHRILRVLEVGVVELQAARSRRSRCWRRLAGTGLREGVDVGGERRYLRRRRRTVAVQQDESQAVVLKGVGDEDEWRRSAEDTGVRA